MRNIVVLLLCGVFCSSCVLNHIEYIPGNAEKGVSDFSVMQYNSQTVINLEGEWEFYWNRYLTPEDFKTNGQNPDTYIKVPDVWNNHVIGGQPVPEQGYATYRLMLQNVPLLTNFGLFINNVGVCFRLYIDGKEIGSVGVPGTNQSSTIPGYHSTLYPITCTNRTIEIIFHVANFQYSRGGIWYIPRFGALSDMIHEMNQSFGLDYFLLGALIIMGIYHLVLYVLRREDISTLYFALLCFSVSLRVICTVNDLITQFFPGIPWELVVRLEYYSFILPTVTFLMFITVILKQYIFKYLHWGVYIVSAVYGLIVLFTPPEFFTRYMYYYLAVLGISMIYILVILTRASLRKNVESFIMLGGFIVLALATLNDILFYSYIFNSFGTLGPLGIFLFFIAKSMVLSIRFSTAFRQVETLSLNLEKKVYERTRELELERNKLRFKNKMIDKEMVLARNIQREFIPESPPLKNIALYYKPMYAIGGDFYDFVRFPDPNLLGVFISDVSGHGIPAALVTSMMKSSLLEIAQHTLNPARVMAHLNHALFDLTANNFITAFYGIFDFSTETFEYCNAGHHPPYILTSDMILKLESKKSPPLALFDNPALRKQKKHYQNKRVVLNKGTKVLLYTDGLSETVPADSPLGEPYDDIIDFETGMFLPILDDIKHETAHVIVKTLREKLIRFRGSEEFEDDVSMICFEI